MTAHVITISREYGSGGRTIGELVAKELGYGFYDKVLIDLAAKKSGFAIDYIKNTEEQVTPNFLFNLAANGYYANTVFVNDGLPASDSLFILQTKIIQELAEKGPCVIVGRCADYVLRDHENVLNVFIKASMEERIKQIVRLNELDPMKAEESIRKADKQRATYYNYYATGNWGDVANYHLCLDTGVLGVDGAVELIRRAVELRQDKAEEDGIQW